METGSNIRKPQIVKSPSLDSERIKHCHTVFNLRPGGLDVLISDENKRNILAVGSFYLEHIHSTDDLINAIEEILLAEKLDFDQCISVKWVLSFPKFSLVPQGLFDEENIAKILRYTCHIYENDVTQYDLWPGQNIVALYAFPKRIKDWISLYFSDARIIHSGTAIHSLSSFYKQDRAFALLLIQADIAELFISTEGETIFFNQFNYGAKEDILYYCLHAFEQNGILAPETDLRIAGTAHKGDPLYKLLLGYIGTVEEIKVPSQFIISPNIQRSGILKLIHLLGVL